MHFILLGLCILPFVTSTSEVNNLAAVFWNVDTWGGHLQKRTLDPWFQAIDNSIQTTMATYSEDVYFLFCPADPELLNLNNQPDPWTQHVITEFGEKVKANNAPFNTSTKQGNFKYFVFKSDPAKSNGPIERFSGQPFDFQNSRKPAQMQPIKLNAYVTEAANYFKAQGSGVIDQFSKVYVSLSVDLCWSILYSGLLTDGYTTNVPPDPLPPASDASPGPQASQWELQAGSCDVNTKNEKGNYLQCSNDASPGTLTQYKSICLQNDLCDRVVYNATNNICALNSALISQDQHAGDSDWATYMDCYALLPESTANVAFHLNGTTSAVTVDMPLYDYMLTTNASSSNADTGSSTDLSQCFAEEQPTCYSGNRMYTRISTNGPDRCAALCFLNAQCLSWTWSELKCQHVTQIGIASAAAAVPNKLAMQLLDFDDTFGCPTDMIYDKCTARCVGLSRYVEMGWCNHHWVMCQKQSMYYNDQTDITTDGTTATELTTNDRLCVGGLMPKSGRLPLVTANKDHTPMNVDNVPGAYRTQGSCSSLGASNPPNGSLADWRKYADDIHNNACPSNFVTPSESMTTYWPTANKTYTYVTATTGCGRPSGKVTLGASLYPSQTSGIDWHASSPDGDCKNGICVFPSCYMSTGSEVFNPLELQENSDAPLTCFAQVSSTPKCFHEQTQQSYHDSKTKTFLEQAQALAHTNQTESDTNHYAKPSIICHDKTGQVLQRARTVQQCRVKADDQWPDVGNCCVQTPNLYLADFVQQLLDAGVLSGEAVDHMTSQLTKYPDANVAGFSGMQMSEFGIDDLEAQCSKCSKTTFNSFGATTPTDAGCSAHQSEELSSSAATDNTNALSAGIMCPVGILHSKQNQTQRPANVDGIDSESSDSSWHPYAQLTAKCPASKPIRCSKLSISQPVGGTCEYGWHITTNLRTQYMFAFGGNGNYLKNAFLNSRNAKSSIQANDTTFAGSMHNTPCHVYDHQCFSVQDSTNYEVCGDDGFAGTVCGKNPESQQDGGFCGVKTAPGDAFVRETAQMYSSKDAYDGCKEWPADVPHICPVGYALVWSKLGAGATPSCVPSKTATSNSTRKTAPEYIPRPSLQIDQSNLFWPGFTEKNNHHSGVGPAYATSMRMCNASDPCMGKGFSACGPCSTQLDTSGGPLPQSSIAEQCCANTVAGNAFHAITLGACKNPQPICSPRPSPQCGGALFDVPTTSTCQCDSDTCRTATSTFVTQRSFNVQASPSAGHSYQIQELFADLALTETGLPLRAMTCHGPDSRLGGSLWYDHTGECACQAKSPTKQTDFDPSITLPVFENPFYHAHNGYACGSSALLDLAPAWRAPLASSAECAVQCTNNPECVAYQFTSTCVLHAALTQLNKDANATCFQKQSVYVGYKHALNDTTSCAGGSCQSSEEGQTCRSSANALCCRSNRWHNGECPAGVGPPLYNSGHTVYASQYNAITQALRHRACDPTQSCAYLRPRRALDSFLPDSSTYATSSNCVFFQSRRDASSFCISRGPQCVGYLQDSNTPGTYCMVTVEDQLTPGDSTYYIRQTAPESQILSWKLVTNASAAVMQTLQEGDYYVEDVAAACAASSSCSGVSFADSGVAQLLTAGTTTTVTYYQAIRSAGFADCNSSYPFPYDRQGKRSSACCSNADLTSSYTYGPSVLDICNGQSDSGELCGSPPCKAHLDSCPAHVPCKNGASVLNATTDACTCVCDIYHAGPLCESCARPFADPDDCRKCQPNFVEEDGSCICRAGFDLAKNCTQCMDGLQGSDCQTNTCGYTLGGTVRAEGNPAERTPVKQQYGNIAIAVDSNDNVLYEGMYHAAAGIVPEVMVNSLVITDEGSYYWFFKNNTRTRVNVPSDASDLDFAPYITGYSESWIDSITLNGDTATLQSILMDEDTWGAVCPATGTDKTDNRIYKDFKFNSSKTDAASDCAKACIADSTTCMAFYWHTPSKLCQLYDKDIFEVSSEYNVSTASCVSGGLAGTGRYRSMPYNKSLVEPPGEQLLKPIDVALRSPIVCAWNENEKYRLSAYRRHPWPGSQDCQMRVSMTWLYSIARGLPSTAAYSASAGTLASWSISKLSPYQVPPHSIVPPKNAAGGTPTYQTSSHSCCQQCKSSQVMQWTGSICTCWDFELTGQVSDCWQQVAGTSCDPQITMTEVVGAPNEGELFAVANVSAATFVDCVKLCTARPDCYVVSFSNLYCTAYRLQPASSATHTTAVDSTGSLQMAYKQGGCQLVNQTQCYYDPTVQTPPGLMHTAACSATNAEYAFQADATLYWGTTKPDNITVVKNASSACGSSGRSFVPIRLPKQLQTVDSNLLELRMKNIARAVANSCPNQGFCQTGIYQQSHAPDLPAKLYAPVYSDPNLMIGSDLSSSMAFTQSWAFDLRGQQPHVSCERQAQLASVLAAQFTPEMDKRCKYTLGTCVNATGAGTAERSAILQAYFDQLRMCQAALGWQIDSVHPVPVVFYMQPPHAWYPYLYANSVPTYRTDNSTFGPQPSPTPAPPTPAPTSTPTPAPTGPTPAPPAPTPPPLVTNNCTYYVRTGLSIKASSNNVVPISVPHASVTGTDLQKCAASCSNVLVCRLFTADSSSSTCQLYAFTAEALQLGKIGGQTRNDCAITETKLPMAADTNSTVYIKQDCCFADF